jgi:hypothetical protein
MFTARCADSALRERFKSRGREHDKIPYLNSAKLASPNDPREYLRDSHFTPEVDNEMARALVKIIDEASHN